MFAVVAIEVETGHWRRTCQCHAEDVYEPHTETRKRLDPLDPSTSQHLPACEFRNATDPATIRAVLKVTDRDDYWRVDYNSCDGVWQVPYFATECLVIRQAIARPSPCGRAALSDGDRRRTTS